MLLAFVSPVVQANEDSFLKKVVESIVSDSNVINAKKEYQLSLIDRKYQYLQWWTPSVTLSNSYVYPYKRSFFDNKATSNKTSLDMAFPLPTATILNLGGSYSLNRDLLETSNLEKLDWGYTQDLEFNIGISQSLNPWWVHSRKNPYSRSAVINSTLSKNEYNLTVKSVLFTVIESYFMLRKIERGIIHFNDTLILYDELLKAQQQLFSIGRISWNEYEKTRLEKWEYERSLFDLEKDRASVQSELYRLTGIMIENANAEILIDTEDALFMDIFTDIQKEAVNALEKTSLYLMKENLQMARLLNRQSNAPLLKIEWSTLFNLPVAAFYSLDSVWSRKNFGENIRNNWVLTVALDLSVFLSPVNRMQERRYNEETRSIDELLKTLEIEKQKEKNYYDFVIIQIKEQIEKLSEIIENDASRVQVNKTLKDRGAISLLEYNQSELLYKEKQTLLLNLQDDLWLSTFIRSYY